LIKRHQKKPPPMNSDYVKMCIAEYYRYERQAPIFSFERSVGSYGNHHPDILVVTNKRRLVEIEVKVSLSDFKADAKKRIWAARDSGWCAMPYQFYYAIPDYLVEKILPLVRKDCGVLSVKYRRDFFSKSVMCNRRAPINKKSKKLSLTRATKMAYNQTGTLCSLMEKNYKLTETLKEIRAKEKDDS